MVFVKSTCRMEEYFHVIKFGGPPTWWYVSFHLGVVILITASVWILRAYGYRMLNLSRKTQARQR